jgi:hypothetical protein
MKHLASARAGCRTPGHVLQDFAIVWSPVNRAWFLLWGRGPLSERTLLGIFASRREAKEAIS